MKIGVTGSTGFLGTHLCERLMKDGHQVIGFDSRNLDIRNKVTLPTVDVVFHLASNPRVFWARKNTVEDFKINALGTVNVLEAMRKADIKKIIYVSSILVYENLAKAKEKDRVGYNVVSGPYGISKLVGEYYVRQYSDYYGMDYVVLRPSAIYGPGMKKNPVFDIMSGFIGNKTIKLFDHIDSEYDFIYVKDLVSALVQSLLWNKQTVNVCDGRGKRLKEVYDIIKRVFNKEVVIEFEQIKLRIVGNNSKIKRLGWRQIYNLEDGLRETIEFQMRIAS